MEMEKSFIAQCFKLKPKKKILQLNIWDPEFQIFLKVCILQGKGGKTEIKRITS